MDTPYDYVIVGAGAAGCVLANRLSATPSVRVLLLEAGGWDWNPMVAIPLTARKVTQLKLHEWRDISDPDPGLHNRTMEIIHGKIVGGGSSVNYMAHTRGHPADYDGWADRGAHGWSYAEVLPFFKQGETWEKGADAWRGGSGEIGAQPSRMLDSVYAAWLEAVRHQGYPISDDYNGERAEGFSPGQYSVRNGRRSSAAREFLHPALRRPNLKVLTGTFVTKIDFEGNRAIGVSLRRGRKSDTVRGREIILSAGAINTPHLLLLSGIGPAAHLKSMGIQPRADLPVGKNLEDHLGYSLQWHRTSPGNFYHSMRLDRLTYNMARAFLTGTGPAALVPGSIMGFIKSDASLRQPDLQLFLQLPPAEANYWFPLIKRPYADALTIRVQLLSQQSRGEVTLKSSDPFIRPRIIYNSLSSPHDLAALRAGYKMARSIGNDDALAAYRGDLMAPDRELRSDAEIDDYISRTAIQLYHPGCTCRMGTGDDCVVTPDLKVKGIEGLRIADASVMPTLVSANLNIPVQMIAAKAAAMILSER